ncbi:TPA_asm: peptidase M3B [Altiarchaeum virus]|nr:TPA_asm: peptidase M3B [Altiarchaeum virus]
MEIKTKVLKKTILVCGTCNDELYKCDKCEKYFEKEDVVFCQKTWDTLHICKECHEGEEKDNEEAKKMVETKEKIQIEIKEFTLRKRQIRKSEIFSEGIKICSEIVELEKEISNLKQELK